VSVGRSSFWPARRRRQSSTYSLCAPGPPLESTRLRRAPPCIRTRPIFQAKSASPPRLRPGP